MSLKIGSKELSLSLTWIEMWGWSVVIGMLLFGLWGFYDGIEVGSLRAGWRFIAMFLIFTAPGFVTMVFFKPKE
ncbi:MULTISPECIES: hypothetical protein [Desulfobacula]|uniref:Uncharacterized protein n=2 Tax=Desulfobacula TaxID=28222 RepID=K0N5Z8_DESTT|nr:MULTISPECIES: hypothetical protein [Desulfobacula]CCK79454.1 uncharacterized protein TOL2_C12910 [Desulfobacula toluolica Tol2]SDT84337.1 hypothetical protein SAMN04487931_101207 [Desulfobacula phenolica]